MSEPPHPSQIIASAIMNAIIDANRSETGEALIDTAQVEAALVMVTAMMMEADPRIQTRRDMREEAERFARMLRHQVEFMRDDFATTGHRAWDAVPVTRQ